MNVAATAPVFWKNPDFCEERLLLLVDVLVGEVLVTVSEAVEVTVFTGPVVVAVVADV